MVCCYSQYSPCEPGGCFASQVDYRAFHVLAIFPNLAVGAVIVFARLPVVDPSGAVLLSRGSAQAVIGPF